MSDLSPVFFTRIENGTFTTRLVRQAIAALEGQVVEVMIRKRRSYRTHPQNAYFHGVVLRLISDEMRKRGATGQWGGPMTDLEVKELLKAKFLITTVLVNPETGEYLERVRGSSELTKSDMSDFIQECIVWAQEHLGLAIPAAGSQLAALE